MVKRREERGKDGRREVKEKIEVGGKKEERERKEGDRKKIGRRREKMNFSNISDAVEFNLPSYEKNITHYIKKLNPVHHYVCSAML